MRRIRRPSPLGPRSVESGGHRMSILLNTLSAHLIAAAVAILFAWSVVYWAPPER